jgi:hypothetical protein
MCPDVIGLRNNPELCPGPRPQTFNPVIVDSSNSPLIDNYQIVNSQILCAAPFCANAYENSRRCCMTIQGRARADDLEPHGFEGVSHRCSCAAGA